MFGSGSSHPLTLHCLTLSGRASFCQVYNNSGWAGIPSATRVVSSLDYSEPVTSSTTPFTLEFTGTLSYPTGQRCFENDAGCFTFNCSFSGATYAFLWFDGRFLARSLLRRIFQLSLIFMCLQLYSRLRPLCYDRSSCMPNRSIHASCEHL